MGDPYHGAETLCQSALSVPLLPHVSTNVTPLTPTPHRATILTEVWMRDPEPKPTSGETFHGKGPRVPDSLRGNQIQLDVKKE